MNRGTIIAIILGVALGNAAGLGAISSQTTWMDEPVIVDAPEWEPIPEEEEPEETGCDPIRTHEVETDVIKAIWGYPNDPDIPDDVEEACNIYGEMYDICPEFLMAIANKETGGTYRADVKSRDGRCWGVMQINPAIHRARIAEYGLSKDDMLTADCCIMVSAAYLRQLFDEYSDPAVVLMKYNGATTALQTYWKTGKMNYYTRYILDKSRELEEKHTRE